MISPALERILPLIEKPSRYIGGEANSVRKKWSQCKLTFALAFPDIYEVGMSHLGIQILYSILNDRSDIVAERVYAPWPDMEGQLRKRNIPLTSLESHAPLNQFDIVGFSLQYELSCTNILNMLDLGGIPIYSKDREENSPIIIAGGPSAFNPAPMSSFIDAFVIGEGEEVILEISSSIVEGKEKGYKRRDILSRLADIKGVYVPSIHQNGETITKRVISDINLCPLPSKPVVPLMNIIHDRITLEIARGCSRGCRFCQAGMVWRPSRERNPELLRKMAHDILSSTGYDEISLLSLSSGDYTYIEDLLTSLMSKYYEKRIAIALPSLRTETLTANLIEQIKKVRKTSFTLAPEAGTQRLRDVINKGNSEEDLLNTARKVFDAGWRSIKLYFMIGLPTETEADLEGILDLSNKVLKESGNKKQVTVSLSTFIPKPHTPFQWERQISSDETQEKQNFFKRNTRHKNLKLKWHDKEMSLLEGLISRGDEKIGDLIARTFAMGCRFDGWSDQLRFDLWKQAINELHINIDDYIRERSVKEILPWDFIDCGLNRTFLLEEYNKSRHGALTADCRFGECSKCGVCGKDVKIALAADKLLREDMKKSTIKSEQESESSDKFRIKFSKSGQARFLSHHEVSAALTRGINRSGLIFMFTEGFHPHPKMSFPYALPVGIESLDEYLDIQVKKPVENIEKFISKINAFLPQGMEIMEIWKIPESTASMSVMIAGFNYNVYFSHELLVSSPHDLDQKVKTFLALGEFTIERERKGKRTKKDIRPLVEALNFNKTNHRLDMTLCFGSHGGVKPLEILTHVLGFTDEVAKNIRIVKIGTFFSYRNH